MFHGKQLEFAAKVMLMIGVVISIVCVSYAVIFPSVIVSGHLTCFGLGTLMHGIVNCDLIFHED